MRSALAACFRKNLASFTIGRLVSGGRACCSLDLIEVGLQICANPLNQREGANGRATFFGELDQVVQVEAEFARGFDRTGNTHLALPRSPSSTRRRTASGREGSAGADRSGSPTASGERTRPPTLML